MTATAEARRADALARIAELAREVFALRGWLALALFWFFVMSHLEVVNPARPLRMSIPLHAFVSAAGAFGLPALGLLRRREVTARAVFAVLWFLCLALLAVANWRFVISHVDHHPIIGQIRGMVRIAAFVLVAVVPLAWCGETRLVVAAFALVAGLLLFDRVRVLAASSSPRIDVFTLANEAAAAFWRGENPYAAEYSNLYEATQLDLGYSPGYNYFPVMLIANALSAKLFGDVRALYVLAEIACVFFLFRFARAFGWTQLQAWAIVALFCCNTLSFQVVEKWNDALVLAGVLGMLAMLAERRWLLAGLGFGFAAAAKQYAPLAVVPLAIWLWRVGPPGSFARVAFGAVLGGGLASLPFLVNQPNWLLHRTVFHFAGTPFRDESLSLLNGLRSVLGFGVDSRVIRVAPYFGLAVGLGAASAITWRSGPSGPNPAAYATQVHRLVVALLFLWAGFFHFIKQSFLNYHYFSLGVSVLLLVSLTQRPGIARFAGAGPSKTDADGASAVELGRLPR